MSNPMLNTKHTFDFIKYKWVWFGITILLLIPCIFAIGYSMITYPTHSPVRLGIDFTGGTIIQYAVDKKPSNDDISKLRNDLTQKGFENPLIQIINASAKDKDKFANIIAIRTKYLESTPQNNEINKVNSIVQKEFKNAQQIQVSAVGPTLGKELFKNSMIALLLAFIGIIGYLTVRFQFDYALFAFMALLHDAIFVVGVFSIMGLLYGVQIDSLFITAILTVIGFSVHDTIVVYDRIRENSRFLAKKKTFHDIINISLHQTMVRSINTSLTLIMTLAALYIWGGVTTKEFVLAMLLGTITGTYSSIFFASMLLAVWRENKETKRS